MTEPQQFSEVSRHASRGMVAMVGSTLVTRAGGLVTQVVLGLFLTDAEFKVYAVALSVALAFQILRDGGIRDVLVQEGADRFEASVGPAFWGSMLLALAGTAVMVMAAPLAAGRFGSPELTAVLIVLALSLPVQSCYIPSLARLQIDLRFTVVARIQVVSAVVRYGGTILLAALGAGALSFAVPVLLVAGTEALMGWFATGVLVARRPSGLRASMGFLARSKWPLLNSLATAVPRQSDYFVLPLVTSNAVVAAYFFAYQLTFQFTTMIYTSARKVLLASFSARHEDDGWLSHALVRSTAALSIGASGGLLALLPVADDVEALLWHGRWLNAVPAIRVFTLCLPLSLILLLPDLALQATGRFRLSFLTSLMGNLGIPVVAYATGVMVSDPAEVWKVAAAVGGYTVLSSALQSGIALRVLRIPPGPFVYAGVAPMLVGLAIGLPLSLVQLAAPAAVRIVVLGGLYGVGYTVLVRVLLRGPLTDAIGAFGSASLVGAARRVLRLGR